MEMGQVLEFGNEPAETASDAALLSWMAAERAKRGLTATAEELGYDPANLVKVLSGRRGLSHAIRTRVAKLLNQRSN